MTIRLVGLGGLRCYVDGVQTDSSAQKLRLAILTYLAVERHAPRESLAALFWPERDEERARHALAQTIYELRRSFGEGWLKPQPDPLEATDRLTIDVLEFEQHIERGDLEQAFALYNGEFLHGFHIKGSNEFESWVDGKRRELKRLHHRACRDHLKVLLETRRYDDAIAHVHHWIDVDPLDDEANHALLDLLVNTGRRAEAMTHYRDYADELKKQLDVQPLEQTQQLMATLQGQPGMIAALPTASVSPLLNTSELQASGLVGELTRRRVFKMAGWYAGSLFLAIQVVQVLVDAFYLVPPGLLTATIVVGAFGFPVALLLSWQFDITPTGIHRTRRFSDTAKAWYSNWRLVAAAILLILITGAAALSTTRARDAVRGWGRSAVVKCSGAGCESIRKVEPNRYVVLPLTHQNSASPHLMDGELCARLISDGLAHWHDVNLADPLAVNDELRKLTPAMRVQIPVDSGISIARRVGAGKLIMGELWQFGDSTRVQAVLYDAVAGKKVKVMRTRFALANIAPEQEFARLAQQLLLEDTDLQVSMPDAEATTSWAALVSYDSAFKAIAKWDLTLAKSHFNNALQRDPDYRHADLWLAQVLLWQRDTSELFRYHAGRARGGKSNFGVTDQLLADGIGLFAERKYAESCESYRALLARDSANFHAWFGLSECLASDRRVIADNQSPSGWSFASSYAEAIRAHERALLIAPSFNESFAHLGSTRMASLLFLNASRERLGFNDTGARFAARPEVVADTMALIPYPYEESSKRAAPSTNANLVARHRSALKQAAQVWAARFPDNTKALEAYALALEQSGELIRDAGTENGALSMIRRALDLEKDRDRKLRLQMIEIRILFKAGEFKDARRLALRTLKAYPHPAPADAQRLAGIAGLVGKAHTMARLMSEGAEAFEPDLPSSGKDIEVPIELARDAGRLLAYAHVGEPKDSLRRISQRAHTFLAERTALDTRQILHEAVLDRAARILFVKLGPDDAHRSANPSHPLIDLQRLVMERDSARFRVAFNELSSRRRAVRPGEINADGILIEAQLQLAVGDTAGAIIELDEYLSDLDNIAPPQFRQPYQGPTIVRIMELRAKLAAKAQDRSTARRWSRAVIDLWRDGDKELKLTLHEMRKLARI